MHIGIIGLGRMGFNMARRLHSAGHAVVVHNKTPEKIKAAEAEGIKGAQMEIVPGAGHISNMEQPETFNQALSSFLETIR